MQFLLYVHAVVLRLVSIKEKGNDGRLIETVHCDNPNCDSQIRKRFTHFVGKKAMNIEGLSETTLEKFLTLGYLQTFPDIYHLNEHQEEILQLEGFGKKSFERLWNSITSSRNTTFCPVPGFHGYSYGRKDQKQDFWIQYSTAVYRNFLMLPLMTMISPS